MNFKRHSKILLNGFVVVAPIIVTLYAVIASLWWLDTTVRAGLARLGWEGAYRGLGIVIGVAGIYVIGLFARTWLLSWPIRIGEAIV